MTTSATTSPTVNAIYLNDYKPNYQHLMTKYHGNNMVTTVVVILAVVYLNYYKNDYKHDYKLQCIIPSQYR